MSIGSAKGMLAQLKKLERSNTATDELRQWVSDTFGVAIDDGRMCGMDGSVVLRCLLNWISDGTARGYAGEGTLR
ncbi:MAG: hypothetical protein Q4A11_01275 [Brachymonas sp.]|nr:hypothetical protein [Brachymonas sp.]